MLENENPLVENFLYFIFQLFIREKLFPSIHVPCKEAVSSISLQATDVVHRCEKANEKFLI
jgi:hypothetical protein